ncbi:hypothetical protein SERLA73DRAFT_146687, partial [Serpula lacrymans var. lacrymans S7.3]
MPRFGSFIHTVIDNQNSKREQGREVTAFTLQTAALREKEGHRDCGRTHQDLHDASLALYPAPLSFRTYRYVLSNQTLTLANYIPVAFMPKKGPPYDPNTADATYVVIVCPWGVHRNSKERKTSDIDRLGAWVRFMLKEAKDSKFRQNTIVECVYMMTTRD